MVSGIPNISIAYTLPQNGRLSLPVDSSSLVYSQLKHVSGVPAQEGTTGINLQKLNLLDTLITSYKGQLEQANTDRPVLPNKPSPSPVSGAFLNLTM